MSGRHKDPLQYLFDRISPEPNTGCWLWLATLNETGYGVATVNGTRSSAHRFSYRINVGPIPATVSPEIGAA